VRITWGSDIVDLTPSTGTLNEANAPGWATKGYVLTASQDIDVAGFEWWINLPAAANVAARIYNSAGTLVASGSAATGQDSERWYRSNIAYTMQAGQTYSIVMYHSAPSTGTFDRMNGATQNFTVSPYATNVGSRSSGADANPTDVNSWFPIQKIIADD
jgi:hypothetical protein